MRTEVQYLKDIVDAADAIARFLESLDRDEFVKDELRQSAVIQKIGVIGEAAGKVSSDLRSRYSDVAWSKIVGMRNIMVHGYFAINNDIVWQTATTAVPELRENVAHILSKEFGVE